MGSTPYSWDRTALAAAYDRHSGNVYGLAYAITGRVDVASTLTERVFTQLGTCPAADAERRLLADVHRLAVAWVRQTERPTAALDPTTGDQPPLAQLPHEERAAIRHAYFGGRTYAEIAAGMQLGGGEVAEMMRRGLQRLGAPRRADAMLRPGPDLQAS